MSGMLIRGHSVAWLMWQQATGGSGGRQSNWSWSCPLGLMIFIWLCWRIFFFVAALAALSTYSFQGHTFNFYSWFYCFVFTAVAVGLVVSSAWGNSIFCHNFHLCKFQIYFYIGWLEGKSMAAMVVLASFHAQFVWLLFLFCRIVKFSLALATFLLPEKGQRTFNVTARWVNLPTQGSA